MEEEEKQVVGFRVILAVVEMGTPHGEQGFVQIAPEIPAVPDTLNMTTFQRLAGIMIVRWNVVACGVPDHPGACKANATGANGELVWGAAEKTGHWAGIRVIVIHHNIESTGIDIFPHRHRTFGHLDNPQGAFLDPNAASGMDIGE